MTEHVPPPLEGFRSFLRNEFAGKKVLLLGFGREGQSSYAMVRDLLPADRLGIADRDYQNILPSPGQGTIIHQGPDYLQDLQGYDTCLRSPGIPQSEADKLPLSMEITSQSDLFLRYFSRQCIGITGTKGKSTTATLSRDMLRSSGVNAILAGNIGLPPFEAAYGIRTADDIIVLELSAHQLREVRRAPHLACVLNLFEEHLDHFRSLDDYYMAKWKIALNQLPGDTFIFNGEDSVSLGLLNSSPPASNPLPFLGKDFPGTYTPDFSKVSLRLGERSFNFRLDTGPSLKGMHQRQNATAAIMLSILAGGDPESTQRCLDTFRGLPHRLEYIGKVKGIHLYNDAIATIPEAVIAAMESLGEVSTLILGGFDRGIRYDHLAEFLIAHPPGYIVSSGPAGKRIHALLREYGYEGGMQWFDRFSDAVDHAIIVTKEGGTLLLSPAAPSYDEFRDFTEKGGLFTKKTGSPDETP